MFRQTSFENRTLCKGDLLMRKYLDLKLDSLAEDVY